MPYSSPFIAVIAACGCWALGTILSKDLLSSVPPITILVLQLFPSVLALWVLVVVSKAPLPRGRLLFLVSLLGLLNPGWSYTLNIFGLERATASVATLLWAAEPIMILCLAWIFLSERLSKPLIGLVACATAGVLLVSGLVTDFFRTTAGDDTVGALLILSGVFLCAVYAVVARSQSADPLGAVALQQSVALVWALAIWPFETSYSPVMLSSLPFGDILKAGMSGLLYYAAAYWLYLYALRLMPASTVGSFFSLIPLFGVVGAYFILGEQMTTIQWTGAILILASVATLLWRLARIDRETQTRVATG